MQPLHQTLSEQASLEADFSANVDEKFVTHLSDGTEVELCFNGSKKAVTLENLVEYIELLIKTRLSEFDTQMKAIKEGINLIMPNNIMFFMTWQDLDMRATGAKTVDIDTLKSITTYDVSIGIRYLVNSNNIILLIELLRYFPSCDPVLERI